MSIDREALRLYAVTDRAWAGDEEALFRQVEAAVRGGARVVQLREKHLDRAAFLEEAGVPCRLAPAHLVKENAVSVALEAEDIAKNGGLVSAQELAPVYLRPPQAELLFSREQ